MSRGEGLTTPDAGEALIKQAALEQCRKSYILCDSTKFDNVSSVTFGSMEDSIILTEKCPERYRDCTNIRDVSSARPIAHCHEERPLSWLKRYKEFMEACDTVNMRFRKPPCIFD